MNMNEKTFTVISLSTYWDCSPDSVYRLLQSGQLRGFKIGNSWRIPGEAVAEFENKPAEKMVSYQETRKLCIT